jgi:hypothetical protein
MKTLVKGSQRRSLEDLDSSASQSFDATWDPDYGVPYWAMWSKPKHHFWAMANLKHASDAILAAPTTVVMQAPGRDQFEQLAASWEAETEFMSRQSQAVIHPDYQRIIGMGPVAVPLILERLRDNPDNWFWALAAITGEDPGENSTTLMDAREAWLDWGRERGYVN